MVMTGLKSLLEHALTRGMDIDDPQTTQLRRQIIQEKDFLKRIYLEWYTTISKSIPAEAEFVLELGSGAGYLDEIIPNLITSEVRHSLGIDIVLDGQRLPYRDEALGGIVMVNVLHHLSSVRCFFAESARCIPDGGVLILIEPWVTPWSRFVYRRLHHEPFQPDVSDWEFPSNGPLSGANGALAWIVFERDRLQFESEFPEWEICSIKPCMPFRYLLSGGVSLRSLMPGMTFKFWRRFERSLEPWMRSWAMFAHIVLRRV
jgi:SAM-dependent methyltransferase